MSSADKRKEAWGYEPRTPRCSNCIGFQKARFDGKALLGAQCGKGGFTITPDGCCDKWSSKKGERLR